MKVMMDYRDRCWADETLPECSKIAVSKLLVILTQTRSKNGTLDT